MDTMLTEQIQRLIADLLQAETRATQLLHLARERRLSFGLPYTYIDEDIAQLVGRLRYMQLVAQRHDPPDETPVQR
jgi:hypothetical protein